MKQLIILLISLPLGFGSVLAQGKGPIVINGEVKGQGIPGDSIIFRMGDIDAKYFENPVLSASVENNRFVLTGTISYPQMVRYILASDRGKRSTRPGRYFIDQTTTSMLLDPSSECGIVKGQTAEEFQNRFIPFLSSKKIAYNCKSDNLGRVAYGAGSAYDSLLYEYVGRYPDSYVALWALIEQFSLQGHSNLREKTLGRFSEKVKKGKPWALLDTDMREIGIKENGRFPLFAVKSEAFALQTLALPQAKYTLVDFWFSRCKPCLEAFPELKRLYAAYQPLGFEIVSVSTDRTIDVPLWPKRIQEYELSWAQYLDENAVESTKLLIQRFPSTFLLDEKGNIVARDLSLKELMAFLEISLGKRK